MEGDFHVSSLKGLLNVRTPPWPSMQMLTDTFQLWLDNREVMAGFKNIINSICAYYSAVAINTLGRQTLEMSLQNVQVAYDVSNDFYEVRQLVLCLRMSTLILALLDLP